MMNIFNAFLIKMEETENNNNTDNIVSTEREQIPTLPKSHLAERTLQRCLPTR